MRVAIPVSEFRGLDSQVYGHFGSAQAFALVDSESLEVTQVANRNLNHVHGMCSPLQALAGVAPDAVIVGGIGGGALAGLQSAGVRVYFCNDGDVRSAVERLKAGQLPEMGPDSTCAGHGHGHGCAH